MPMAIVAIVMIAPARKYSMNPIWTLRLACCATMRLATDPMRVKLPARVLLMASVSQKICPSPRDSVSGLSSMTAGTLLTRFERTRETADSPAILPGRDEEERSDMDVITVAARPDTSTPCITTKRPAKNRSKVQSTPSRTRSVRMPPMSSSRTAPAAATRE